MSVLSAQDVANYFLAQISEDCGDTISNLKLQKLLYYAQGFHLALFDTPLFTDQIQAWQHGPVVPSVYRTYSHHRDQAIPKPTNINWRLYKKEVKQLLDEIWKVYGQFSAWKLRNMTHDEPPFKNTVPNGVITRGSMREYFKGLLKK